MSDAAIALSRFGLGARPDEAVPSDPKRWLTDQLALFDARPAPIAAAPTSAAVAGELATYYDQQRDLRAQYGPRKRFRAPAASPAAAGSVIPPVPAPMNTAPGRTTPWWQRRQRRTGETDPFREARQMAGREARGDYAAAVAARIGAALTTPTPFAERLVHFWSNHFAVSVDKLDLIGLGGTLEFEAIRPHLMGRFVDMLGAVERHPAMLLYLDQAISVGPNSPLGQRIAGRGQRKVGLNENLAREIMELHTLGVRTGYTRRT